MNDDEPHNPFTALLEKFEKLQERGQKIADRATLERDRHLQNLRVRLSALVDDPTSTFTESDFARTYTAYIEAHEAIGEALRKTGTATGAILLQRLLAEGITATANHMEKEACSCPDCEGK